MKWSLCWLHCHVSNCYVVYVHIYMILTLDSHDSRKNILLKNIPFAYTSTLKMILKKTHALLIYNIYVEHVFENRIFQQSFGIPMGANCALLFANLFLYSYETELQRLVPVKNHLLWPVTLHIGISTTSYQLTIIASILTSTWYQYRRYHIV